MSKKIKKSAKKLNKQLGSGAVILFMVAITIVSIGSILHIKTDKVLANESSWNVINVNGKSYRLVE